jgi:hypothetical protein
MNVGKQFFLMRLMSAGSSQSKSFLRGWETLFFVRFQICRRKSYFPTPCPNFGGQGETTNQQSLRNLAFSMTSKILHKN